MEYFPSSSGIRFSPKCTIQNRSMRNLLQSCDSYVLVNLRGIAKMHVHRKVMLNADLNSGNSEESFDEQKAQASKLPKPNHWTFDPLGQIIINIQGKLGKGKESALERAIKGAIALGFWEIIFRVAEREAIRGAGGVRKVFAGEVFPVALPFLGGLFVLYLASEDWKGAQETKSVCKAAHRAFLLAFFFDVADAIAHAVVGFSILEDKLGVGFPIPMYFTDCALNAGILAAALATIASVAGDVLLDLNAPLEASRDVE